MTSTGTAEDGADEEEPRVAPETTVVVAVAAATPQTTEDGKGRVDIGITKRRRSVTSRFSSNNSQRDKRLILNIKSPASLGATNNCTSTRA